MKYSIDRNPHPSIKIVPNRCPKCKDSFIRKVKDKLEWICHSCKTTFDLNELLRRL